MGTPTGPYPLNNTHDLAVVHHVLLSRLFDDFSLARTRDLLDLRGTRCMDVGAGGGEYAVRLAELVGETGHVLAIDKSPLLAMTDHPRVEVRQHDLTADKPLDDGWDFVHARLTLLHLPQRRTILHRLVNALKPGGTILVEDWDASRTDMVLAAPSDEAADLYTTYQRTVGQAVFAAAGTDRAWARQIHAAMLDEDLSDVETIMHARAWPGGGDGCRLTAATLQQVRPRLRAAGLTDDHLDAVRALLQDPRLVLAGHLLYSTSGRRPPR